ncbi:MAG: radical SAM protein [Proteobacteria bacterium]|nr:radical SAM protein [Pseudomonadota bacterium]
MKNAERSLILVHPPSVSKRYLPTRFPPHGLAALYAGLSRRVLPVVQFDRLMDSLYSDADGLDVHGRDRNLPESEFREYLDTGQGPIRLTDFVDRHLAAVPGDGAIYAFSAVSYYQLHGALLLASELLRRRPEVVIALGGPCVTVKPATYGADFSLPLLWIKGCGIEPLSGLLRGDDPESLPGLLRFDKGLVRTNPPSRPPAENEPAPDFTGLDMEAYRYDHADFGPTIFLPYRLTKGCPSACAFCSGRLVDPFSAKSKGKVAAELAELTARYGSKAVMFTDASVNALPEVFLDVCRLLARDLPGLRWYAYARVHGFTDRMAEAAAAAGCFALFFGVESAHPPTIRLLGKGFETPELFAALDAASGAGIKGVAHLMYNTPHETADDVSAFLRLVGRYDGNPLVEFMAQRFLLEPGTLMFAHPERYGLAKLRPMTTGFFDRTEYAYDLADGASREALRERHAVNRHMLEPVLARLEERIFSRDASGIRLTRELM